ncbi:MAG: cob(I)yrinic acid a,c-diamide adenosyltransferase [Selenomonadaceae bacterium]|nr:cob(I)yrinic acid a,c-diamide adenosyltransferase [Selenomonadaceae bacterium]
MLQVYTGNGKGKTTAAIGLAIRALGAGKRVYIMQFMKSLAYSEQEVLKGFAPQLCLETSGKPFFIAEEGMLTDEERKEWGEEVVVFPKGKPPADYVLLMENGLRRAKQKALEGQYDLIILDEINVALAFDLISRENLEDLLEKIPPEAEIVCTGRKAPKWLTDRADLVTDMREVRHYYQRGILARKGIEN